MKIAVEGCCHGELDKIYETLWYLEQSNNVKVDLLLICGDFQAVRNKDDLSSMAVPPKYQKLNTFYKYYSGEKEAPVLTIFIGGNHEASNYMQELPYGGWVAKNIYYMGYANVIQIGGLRIGGLSGIFKQRDYNKGHFEHAPFTEETKRSVYHIRNLEVFRLKQLARPIDIFLSHDWPTDIAQYGNKNRLFKLKPFLKEEIDNSSLGSPPAAELLHRLQPQYWFAAHLHVKFTAHVLHPSQKSTKFLSLDKCLPRRQFLQILDIPHKEEGPFKIRLDPEWLCVLKSTNGLLNLHPSKIYMPGPGSSERYNFEVTDADIEAMIKSFGEDLTLPENFEQTAPSLGQERTVKFEQVRVNPQTSLLCSMLEITDPNAVLLGISTQASVPLNSDEIDIASDDTDEVEDNEEMPTFADSSLDLSCTGISINLSDSYSDVGANSASAYLSDSGRNSTQNSLDVADDDEEFMSIMAAQRSNSLASEKSLESPRVTGSLNSGSKEATSCLSIVGSEKSFIEGQVLEKEVTEPATDIKNDISRTCANGKSICESKTQSCTEAESISVFIESSQGVDSYSCSSATESQGSDSDVCGKSGGLLADLQAANLSSSPIQKRPSPHHEEIISDSKKLKRRNQSFYMTSGEEENAS